ncbi:DUF547 domain-containing protein [Legionella oakridgensis]|uniref:DUF547 domain-containing protein n=2 Tax=Legionella oakridgensis TaxID=29423 RepID=W0BBP0_9GAMM|nr:DUF547 domain-containing protein [Legionella oakridgensis]AHE66047.1 hypothetical protein Loa_00470 [Legionella oakridgensis ATCC 33761 = DSM 21215]ETO94197.1 hypothetical protein LOR_22c01920 [Legionella oakridgensis RV-2-2007]KTD43548.1 putative Ser/Thr protein kinase [Legionella oakridgensis]STY15969.1 putative Ser/Thr protein kinase [Legionella longbeachae]
MNMVNLKLRFGLLVFGLLFSTMAMASFHKNLWPRWSIHNPLSTEVIPHQEWQDFLSRCVVTNQEGINLVDYPHLSKRDLDLLERYINRLSQIDITNYNRQEQLAFWLNLYNALTVQIIAHYYPVASIQEINISPGLFSVGPWGANLITLNGIQLSLDEIHNRIIRAIWNDPRTHYAINNGSIGAANLSKQAFQGALLENQLNEAASQYINSLRGTQIIEGKLIVSKIYDWFIDDFGGEEQDLIKHLSQYAYKPLREKLKQINKINTYTYNWHLNSTITES